MSFGDLRRVETSGASAQTGERGYSGVGASKMLADADYNKMNQYRGLIQSVGSRNGVDPALIAGIISRESRAGSTLNNGWGERGQGWGLMQVNITRGSGQTPVGAWNSEEHLNHATGILVGSIREIQRMFPSWNKEQQLKGGVAAYKKGSRSIRTLETLDQGTPGGDYSNDVIARAQWYKDHGY